ncbi:MAG TPA: TIGR02302 family protein [Alphaproteobacteria bacterium]|nr:TIGR02302 family protein [Alphaproteobacteria bacterium]
MTAANQTPKVEGLRPRTISLARLALLWETVWPSAWPALGTLGLFAALACFGVFTVLPGWLHVLLLAGFASALAIAIFRGVRTLRSPSIAEAERRIERDSGLVHRPLTALDDKLAIGAGDDFTETLWRAHLERMRKAIGKVRVKLPRPGLAGRDPMALRLLIVLLLGLGLLEAGGAAPERLMAALMPQLGPLSASNPAVVQLWLTPPSYTGLAPIFVTAGERDAKQAAVAPKDSAPTESAPRNNAEVQTSIDVPAGSKVLARVQGGSGAVRLLVGGRVIPFKSIDDATSQLEDSIVAGDTLTVEQGGRAIGQWRIHVVPDLPPKVAFASPPSRTLRASLKIEYAASHEYGLASVKAEIRRKGGAAGETPIELELPLASGHPKDAHETSFHDLTPHPWAGLPVTIQLLAADEPGLVGKSEALEITLPERNFTHPVARAIIEQRKRLTVDPDSREQVADILSQLAAHPDTFSGDYNVFLALIAARGRLRLAHEPSDISDVQQLLWDTALAIEDGHLSLAERELRDLQQQLMDALDRNAPDKEIEDLIAKLEEAIDRYLQAMMEEQLRNPDKQQQEFDKNAHTLEMQDLHKMLDQLREMTRTGARDAARQMLAQLQEMLENMRMARMNPNGQQGRSGAQNLMRGMDDLINRQDKLLQRTFRESQLGGSGMPMQRPGSGNSASEQEALRKMLGDLMRRMGEMSGQIPDALGLAERAMRDSSDALGRGEPGEAVNPQSQALDQLRRGRQAMMEGLRQRLGEEGDTEDLDAFGPARDPLGRTMPGYGNFDANDVQIPDHGTMQRAREIQEELQRRAGQRQRPPIEREYIDRLLKRF